jgi:hypothetical protein
MQQKALVPHRPTPSFGPASPEAALLRLRSESLEDAYQAWQELKLAHADFLGEASRRRRIAEEDSNFVLGAMAKARLAASSDAGLDLPVQNVPDHLMQEASARVDASKTVLDAAIAETERAFAQAFDQVRSEALARVRRYAQSLRPTLQLIRRPGAGGRTFLHLKRLSHDAAIVLCFLLTGRAPTRYEFLADEATDDVSLPPPLLYPDEGVPATGTRPGAQALRDVLENTAPFLPIRAALWVPLSGNRWFRFLQRGPVLELENLNGDQFENVLPSEQAQEVAAALLALKLRGLIELEWLAD